MPLKILSRSPLAPPADVVDAVPVVSPVVQPALPEPKIVESGPYQGQPYVTLPWDTSVSVHPLHMGVKPENFATLSEAVYAPVGTVSNPPSSPVLEVAPQAAPDLPAPVRKGGLTILKREVVPTILTELKALAEGKHGTLMLIQKATGMGFRVRDTKHVGGGVYQTRLVGPNGEQLHPRITNNEVKSYDPLWR